MKRVFNMVMSPREAFGDISISDVIRARLKLASQEIPRVLKRSIDARKQKVVVRVQYQILTHYELAQIPVYSKDYPNVSSEPPVIIIGAGPAGLFGALKVIELGFKPIILERGKDVPQRRRDLVAINRSHQVNPDSNYCFGEGGAGTFSDGKLYTRSKKRGDVERILQIFVEHGANSDILIDAHPHIGTNKLPKIVTQMRNTIEGLGGKIYFETRVTDLIIREEEIKGIITSDGTKFQGIGVILATGHSARDIFELLNQKNILIQPKPFALGLRIEHTQSLIDKIQYDCINRGPYLPASVYALSTKVNVRGKVRGVFSFCMCPGGFIVPAATAPGEIVVNGMSPSRRNSKFANSGVVTSIELEDLKDHKKYGPLAALQFQRVIEQKACKKAEGDQTAPAQNLMDFLENKMSRGLLLSSYVPGLINIDLKEVLPSEIIERLVLGLKNFGKRMPGYLTDKAQLIGVESRTSSPVRIPRDPVTLEHLQIKRLFPCGEGAGYAGGIVSAAIDGVKCAEKLLEKYK
ncbi:MAG: NAD(P)/FAD-dependent oxidoreductase [Bacteroidetes bacterium]|nr:NAD(P)/FAD-dependent oxidoreductase [Bacteroidota bacterium]